jgi:hypothetical protein
MNCRKYRRGFYGFLLGWLLVLPVGAEESGAVLTNAAGGVFASNQNFWFSVNSGERLRLILDGVEVYRGEGPASIELKAPLGEERNFSITGERFSAPPEEALLETRSYLVLIDRKAPQPPRLAFRGLSFYNPATGFEDEPGLRAAAYADFGDGLFFIPDMAAPGAAPALSFAAVVWAVDRAGNTSEPAPVFFEFPCLRIENPVPGNWANPQLFILYGAEGKNVFWTADGSDPLGSSGRLYQGPERVNKFGKITIRAAYRDETGRMREETVAYTVTGDGSAPDYASNGRPLYENFRFAEESLIRNKTELSVPRDSLWSIGGAPYNSGGGTITLRPLTKIKRTVPIHLSGSEGIYRFVCTLDGTNENYRPSGRRPETGSLPLKAQSLKRDGPEALNPPRLVYAGRSRVVYWPAGDEVIRYSFGITSAWQEGKGPVCIPPEGGTLRWITEKDGLVSGHYGLTIDPLPPERKEENTRGCFVYRYNFAETEAEAEDWRYVSDFLDYDTLGFELNALGQNDPITIDACDGEDIRWSFISPSGQSRKAWHTDRRAPPAPRLDAPDEGAWRRGPVTIRAENTGETGDRLFIGAQIRYGSGRTESLKGEETLLLPGEFDGIAAVHVEAYMEDEAGNRGTPVVRNFILDPKTVYVSSRIAGKPPESGGQAEPGSRDRPFNSLEEALDFAQKEGGAYIRMTGSQDLSKSFVLSGNVVIEGSYDSLWNDSPLKSTLTLSGGAAFELNRGSLRIAGINLERRKGLSPFLTVGKDAVLEIKGSLITHMGAFLRIGEGGACFINDTQVVSLTTGNQRNAAAFSHGGRLVINRGHFELEGEYGLLFDITGGSLEARESLFQARAQKTGTLFILNGVKADFNAVNAEVSAHDYGSVLEMSDSTLVMTGSSVSVSAGDGVGIIADNAEAFYLKTEFTVKSSFVARAMELRNLFPSVTECRFSFQGTARQSEVFYARQFREDRSEIMLPEPGAVADSVFNGFTHLLGNIYPAESILGFNRAFAPLERPNSVLSRNNSR